MTAILEIHNLHARLTGGREIFKGVSLVVNPGDVHAIMGPNGAGKLTLSSVLVGKPGYEVTEGSVTYMGRDLLALAPDERARAGVFLAFHDRRGGRVGFGSGTCFRTAGTADRRAHLPCQGQMRTSCLTYR